MHTSLRSRELFRSLGIVKSSLVITAVAIAISLVVTLLGLLLFGTIYLRSLILAFVIPAIVGPLMSQMFLRIIIELDEAEDQLRKLAITDELTSIYNRRHFLDLAGKEIERAHRFGKPFSTILLDIDNFKRINDEYGHGAGDEVLIRTAAVCLRHCRRIDTFARFGGDEFIFLLPECSLEEAVAFAERIRTAISEMNVEYLDHTINLTSSLGVQAYSGEDDHLDNLLLRTDQAMYDAKESGKNKTSTTAIAKQ